MSTDDDRPYPGGPAGPAQPASPPGYAPPPGYGPPGYGPPGYGAPVGYGPPPGYPPSYRRPTNTLAVLALVMAFVFAPAGLVLGIVARRQIRQTGEEGDGLALAGIIVGAIACALVVLLIVAWFVLVASLAGASFGP